MDCCWTWVCYVKKRNKLNHVAYKVKHVGYKLNLLGTNHNLLGICLTKPKFQNNIQLVFLIFFCKANLLDQPQIPFWKLGHLLCVLWTCPLGWRCVAFALLFLGAGLFLGLLQDWAEHCYKRIEALGLIHFHWQSTKRFRSTSLSTLILISDPPM